MSRIEELLASRLSASTMEALEAIDKEIATLSEGNGHSKPPTQEPEGLAAALREVQRGADFYTVVLGIAPFILAGDLAESVARSVLLAAYPKPDGPDLFSAALMEAAAAPTEVPYLSHKDPQKSALAFLDLCHTEGTRLLYRHHDQFYRWVGTHYAVLDRAIVRNQVWRFLPKGRLKPNSARVSNVMDCLDGETHLPDALMPPVWLKEPDPEYGDPLRLVPLRSGLLDPDTGTLHRCTPRLFYRFSLPFDYDPADAEPPTEWLRFLSTIWGEDPQSIDCLQEVLGYLLTPDISKEKMFLIIGPPRSGKGTIARVIEGILGRENCAASSLATLSGDHGLQTLIDKSTLIIPDAMVSAKTDIIRAVEALKMISGQDPVTINPKNKPPFTTHLHLHTIIMANEIPRFTDASNAFASRFILLRMTRSFLGEEDEGWKARLMPELPRILHWALAGRRRLYARGYFVLPDSAREIMAELEESSSPMLAFLRDKCVQKDGEEIEGPTLWALWGDWCRASGRSEGNSSWFFRDLRSAVPRLEVVRRNRGAIIRKVYLGIGPAL
jgi:putative DNA primase/helicase